MRLDSPVNRTTESRDTRPRIKDVPLAAACEIYTTRCATMAASARLAYAFVLVMAAVMNLDTGRANLWLCAGCRNVQLLYVA